MNTEEIIKEKVESMMQTVKKSMALKDEIIMLQEKLIEEVCEQNDKMTNRVRNSFGAGCLFGFLVAVVICSIINIVIASIK